MKRVTAILSAVISAFCIVACNSDDDADKKLLTFHVGSKNSIDSGISRETVVMPLSEFAIITNKDQFMYSGDIDKVELAQVNDRGGPVSGFYFTCQERGQKRLVQATGANMGGFIVVKFDGAPIGLRKIDTVITDGRIFVCSEVAPGTDLEKFVEEMNASIKKVNEIKSDADKW